MMTLGINAAFHDSAACLIKDGELIAAAEEERFTRIKHGKRPVPFSAYELPFYAIHYCLQAANAFIEDIDHIAYSFNPALFMKNGEIPLSIELPIRPGSRERNGHSHWDPLFYTYILNAPDMLRDGAPHHLQRRLWRDNKPHFLWHYVDHHLAHAASAFLVSPFTSSAILTLDGRGENATTTYGLGKGKSIDIFEQVTMPHSLGILYEKITDHLGFLHSSDEYKVMALASFGKPRYLDEFRALITVKNNGLYEIEQVDFEKLFGPRRVKGGPLNEKHFDIAHSLQAVLEEIVLKLADYLQKTTGEKNLCMAGGVALNCVMNSRIRDKSSFKNIWIQPAAGDAGTALGAALLVDSRQRDSFSDDRKFIMEHAYWGPEFRDEEIEAFLKKTKTPYRRMTDPADEISDILLQEKMVGWFQGRMEFGPRALGARSILSAPFPASVQQKLNDLKGREEFRPVAPVIPEEDVPQWFKQHGTSPFMLFVYDVLEERKDKIPAVCHVDLTARIQTVKRNLNPLYYDLLAVFKQKTGIPLLVNTSFNTRERPIVCTPQDAVECFWTSPIDALAIGSFLLKKEGVR